MKQGSGEDAPPGRLLMLLVMQVGSSVGPSLMRSSGLQISEAIKGQTGTVLVEFSADTQVLTLKDSKSPFPLWGFQLDGLAKLNEINLIREMDGAH